MATRLTKKQQGELTEKLTGIIQKNNALQLRLSADRSVNEMSVNQISGALNRIHGQAIGKDLPTVVTIPVKQTGSGTPSPDNIRPIVGYTIDGIGTIYGGELNIETGILTNDRAVVTFETGYTWQPGSPIPNIRINIASALGNYSRRSEIICDQYFTISTGTQIDKAVRLSADERLILIYDTRFVDLETTETLTAANPIHVVYPLAEPSEASLTIVQMLQLIDQL